MDKNRKVYKKINRSGIVGTIIRVVLFSSLAGLILYFVYAEFVSYILLSKLSTEYEKAVGMAEIYDKASDTDAELFNDTEYAGTDYIIMDGSGERKYVSGEDTCGKNSYAVDNYLRPVVVYQDTKTDTINFGKRSLKINWPAFFKEMEKQNAGKFQLGFDITTDKKDRDDDDDDEDEDYGIVINEPTSEDYEKIAQLYDEDQLVAMPIWVCADANGGSEKLARRSAIYVNMKDLTIFVELYIAVGLIIFILIVSLIANAIKALIQKRRITSLFTTDAATGAKNWMYYIIKGEDLIKKRRNARVPFAIVNLCFVNYRNYCLCHSVQDGEKLLTAIYRRTVHTINPNEICARASSSNFALVLRGGSDEEIKQRLDSLIQGLSTINQPHTLTFQAGVNVLRPNTDAAGRTVRRNALNLETEYNNACSARAKLSDTDGSGVAFFDDRLVDEEKWVDIVHEKQQQALMNEEFQVYYQPKYDPRTNELKGAEALIRWASPEYGFVTPYRIIPIFEKNGFITAIDDYMITHVARHQKMWLDKGLKCVPVSVNVSRAHFADNNLAEHIRDLVDREGAPRNLIEIELTESAFFDDKRAMIETIKKLKDYGFMVSMDDFGAGYSSLNSLKDMPLDVLKLDADFFRGENAGERGEIVVSEAIKLAKSLHMKTVAEGVEEKDQVDFLAAQGCDMIQGYYFAKPMPMSDYETRMQGATA